MATILLLLILFFQNLANFRTIMIWQNKPRDSSKYYYGILNQKI